MSCKGDYFVKGNLFPVDARLTKAWDSRDELRDCESAGEKAMGVDKDKRKSRGREG